MNKANGSLELDTGFSVTIIRKAAWVNIGKPELSPEQNTLRSFTGHEVKLLGKATVDVQYRNITK